jgi:hypothetical protein
MLPWRRLAAIALAAAVAAVPASVVSRTAAWPAPAAVMLTGTLYVLSYGLLWQLSVWWERSGRAATLLTLLPRVDSAE